MGRLSIVFSILVVYIVCVYSQTSTYSFSSFDATADSKLQLNGYAAYYNPSSNNELLLSISSPNTAGSAFLKNAIPLTGDNGFQASFSTAFAFQITNSAGISDEDGVGADGLVFCINSVTNQVGSTGGGIGYQGVPRSVGIEFDTWNNGLPQDKDGNHVGIDINGNIVSTVAAHYGTRMNDGNVHYAWIDFDGSSKTMEIRIADSNNRPASPFISSVVDLVSIFQTADVYVGFTSAGGSAYGNHYILSWTFTNQYAPIITTPPPAPAVCGNGVIEGSEQCDGGSCCTSSCTFQNSATVCRSSAGSCDVVEYCTGSSPFCPLDTFLSSSVVCSPSNGPCEAASTCTGSSATCPANSFSSSSTVCRASNGVCDVPEFCTGSDASCPADSHASTSTVCRASNGICDVAETCDGVNSACPADSFASTSTVCRASTGVCDVAETCTGFSSTCPSDSFASTSTVCRPSAGICDVAETCDGTDSACPADSFEPSSYTCRPSAGICDVSEQCTGSSASCPADGFQSSSTVCRPSNGVCDAVEQCTGSSASCPADAFQPTSTVCRPSVGICDVSESCTGSSVTCPADSFEPSTFVCRSSIGPCDPAESCSGNSGYCPADVNGEWETQCPGLDFTLGGSNYSFLDFNVISFGDFIANTGDIDGRLAARGNVVLGSGYSIGYNLNTVYGTDKPRPFSLVAGGSVTWPSGALYPEGTGIPFAGAQEDMFVGGSFTGPDYLEALVVGGPCPTAGCLNSYFDAVQSCYTSYQASLASNQDNVNSVLQWSGLYLTCNSFAPVYYLTLDASAFSQFTYVVSDSSCNSNAKWVINIGGTGDVTLTGATFPAPANAVVYNVLGSGRTVNVENISLGGSVFAPNNNLYQPNGVITGRVVAGDVIMSLQVNQPACYSPPASSTNVPSK